MRNIGLGTAMDKQRTLSFELGDGGRGKGTDATKCKLRTR